MFSWIKI